MPKVKDFKKTQSAEAPATARPLSDDHTAKAVGATDEKAKRRPGRDIEAAAAEAHEPEVIVSEPDRATSEPHLHTQEVHHEWPEEEPLLQDKKKIEISFFGSEILRAKLPRPFEVAEAVATDWVNDGKFEELHLGHPLAEAMATTGLRKAKELEKKIIDSGVVEKVAMQALTAGLKAQAEINSIRDQVKAKLGKK